MSDTKTYVKKLKGKPSEYNMIAYVRRGVKEARTCGVGLKALRFSDGALLSWYVHNPRAFPSSSGSDFLKDVDEKVVNVFGVRIQRLKENEGSIR